MTAAVMYGVDNLKTKLAFFEVARRIELFCHLFTLPVIYYIALLTFLFSLGSCIWWISSKAEKSSPLDFKLEQMFLTYRLARKKYCNRLR